MDCSAPLDLARIDAQHFEHAVKGIHCIGFLGYAFPLGKEEFQCPVGGIKFVIKSKAHTAASVVCDYFQHFHQHVAFHVSIQFTIVKCIFQFL